MLYMLKINLFNALLKTKFLDESVISLTIHSINKGLLNGWLL